MKALFTPILVPSLILYCAPAQAWSQSAKARMQLADAQGILASPTVLQELSSREAAFRSEMAGRGFQPPNRIQRRVLGASLAEASMDAFTLPTQADTFFQRRSLYLMGHSEEAAGVAVEQNLALKYLDGRATITTTIEFSRTIDGIVGGLEGLAGMTLERVNEFEIEGFEAFVSSVQAEVQAGSFVPGSSLARAKEALDNGLVSVRNMTERTSPPNLDRFASEALSASRPPVGSDPVQDVIDCFTQAGIGIGLGTAAAVVLGSAACACLCFFAGPACAVCFKAVFSAAGISAQITAGSALLVCLIAAIFRDDSESNQACPIPTLSGFGVLILASLLLVGGAVMVGRSQIGMG